MMAWLIVTLWAAAVIAFTVNFFRNFGGLRGFVFALLGLAGFIASVVLQAVLMQYSGYTRVVESAARLGWGILIFAVVVLVTAMIAGIVYTLRHGQSDRRSGGVITENRPLSSVSLRNPFLTGRSRVKIRGSKAHAITTSSLVDGTATFAERMIVLDIVIIFVAFFLIFLGVGLIMMKNLLI